MRTLALAFALVAASAAAQELPAPVAAALKENADLCREVGGTPHTADAVKSADLTGDGKPDYVLYLGWIRCDGAASLYGDREKVVTVYVGDAAGGAAEAFSGMVYDAKLEGAGASTKLWLTVSGGGCGTPPEPDFAHENFCDRRLDWSAKTKKLELAPVSTVRMIE